MHDRTFAIPAGLSGQTLAFALRQLAGPLSWSEARRLIGNRHVRVGGHVCVDDARRLKTGERIELAERPGKPAPREQNVHVLHLDAHLIVVEKPAGMQTVRRHEERGWDEGRKQRQPTLDEVVQRMLPGLLRGARPVSRVRAVHRLDSDTSGLTLFALSPAAQEALVKMFATHTVQRTYLAVVQGKLTEHRTIESQLVRDRGDGLRGSSRDAPHDPAARQAITHVRPLEHFSDLSTLVECRLETGRTHQIRIHLSEIGHPLCGEQRYTSQFAGSEPRTDASGAPRQALHSAELELEHPITRETLRFASLLPRDLSMWVERLRKQI